MVAVFSGYFTMAQFRAFTNSLRGKRSACFAQKLMEKGYARIRGQARRGSLFHLFSRTVYGLMDKDNLHNCKRHSLEFVRTRLVLLDFILANQELDYFETEQDKVNFFCNELRISKDCLPVKVYEGATPDQQTMRYFVDKFPVFLAPPLRGVSPVVTFSYVDAGFERPSHFASHLAAYQPLFRQLRRFRFVYIAPFTVHFARAEQCFSSLVKTPLPSGVSGELEQYFRLRAAWDGKQYGTLSTEDIEWLDQANKRFRGPRIEQLYSVWCCGETRKDEYRELLRESQSSGSAEFFTYLVTPAREEKRKELARDT